MIEKHFLILTMDLVGWFFLMVSWIGPTLIKDNEKKHAFGLVTGAIALGIFIATCIVRWY
jgi:hypothetical protein